MTEKNDGWTKDELRARAERLRHRRQQGTDLTDASVLIGQMAEQQAEPVAWHLHNPSSDLFPNITAYNDEDVRDAEAIGWKKVRPLYAAPAQPQPPKREQDTFNGEDAALIRNAQALLDLDASGSLVPHGIGGHARAIIAAFIARSSGITQQGAEK